MVTRYKVKLNPTHTAKPDQVVDGYLGNVFGDGKIARYKRGDAQKKAFMFDGKIELIKSTVSVSNVRMCVIDENCLLHGVELRLTQFNPAFKAFKKTDVIYTASIFQRILDWDSTVRSGGVNEKQLNQLEELADIMVDYDYVCITNRKKK